MLVVCVDVVALVLGHHFKRKQTFGHLYIQLSIAGNFAINGINFHGNLDLIGC